MKKIMVVDDDDSVLDSIRMGLEQLKSEYNVICVDSGRKCIDLLKNDMIQAYAVVRPQTEDRAAIGPMVADKYESAEKLLLSLLKKYNGYRIGMGVPETNRRFIELLRRMNFQHSVPSLRMYQGRRLNYEEHICCIISPEKG